MSGWRGLACAISATRRDLDSRPRDSELVFCRVLQLVNMLAETEIVLRYIQRTRGALLELPDSCSIKSSRVAKMPPVSEINDDSRIDSGVSEEIARTATELEHALGVPVEIWSRGKGWRPCTAPRGVLDPVSMACHLGTTFHPRESVVVKLDHTQSLAMMPLVPGARSPLAAVCVLECRDSLLVERLLAAVGRNLTLNRRLDELTLRLDAYADHVSLETEQLCWLQKLTEQIESCDPRLGLDVVGQKVLPELCALLQAETVVLVPNSQQSGQPISARASGVCDVPMSLCRMLIDRYGPSVSQQPLVCNHLDISEDSAIDQRPGSLIMVPLATNGEHFGWLLALNRQPRAAVEFPTVGREFLHTIDAEFGSIEGGLLKAAGIILASHAKNSLLFQQKEDMLVGIVRALVNTIDAKDAYTFGHSDRVALFARRIARQLGYDAVTCERILLTGLLHDIGKIGVPDAVLQKPGKLTDDEFRLIQRHPEVGYNILKHIEHLDYVLDGVLHHHESYDGRGYPHNLADIEIPLVARIIAVADAYDAMTSSRPYRHAMPRDKAESILRENSGKIWDPIVIDAFFDALDDIHEISRTERDHAEQILNPQQHAAHTRRSPVDDVVEAIVTSQRRQHVFSAVAPVEVPRDVEFHLVN